MYMYVTLDAIVKYPKMYTVSWRKEKYIEKVYFYSSETIHIKKNFFKD